MRVQKLLQFPGIGGNLRKYQWADAGGKLLKSLEIDDNPELLELMDWHIKTTMEDRQSRRDRAIEENFIHGNVLAYLSHGYGGLSPKQMAQMRNLCVLFIAMTSEGYSVNWLMDMQAILDKNRCPIVQIEDHPR